MPIITLTSDFGIKDHSVAAVKGAIYSEFLDATIVDISHSISPFNISEAAYIIQSAYRNFPKGTIHIIGIDSDLSPENKHIAISLDDHYFICANNGIMSMICQDIIPDKIVEIDIHDRLETSFTVLDVFVNVACHLARGGSLDVIGKVINSIKPIINLVPFVNDEKNHIIGSIIYIDNYGNVITNIKRKLFETVQKGRLFTVSARSYKFKKIYNRYNEIIDLDAPSGERNDEGKALVVFNSSNYLEIAVYKSNCTTVGGASTLMGLKPMDTVTVTFTTAADNKNQLSNKN